MYRKALKSGEDIHWRCTTPCSTLHPTRPNFESARNEGSIKYQCYLYMATITIRLFRIMLKNCHNYMLRANSQNNLACFNISLTIKFPLPHLEQYLSWPCIPKHPALSLQHLLQLKIHRCSHPALFSSQLSIFGFCQKSYYFRWVCVLIIPVNSSTVVDFYTNRFLFPYLMKFLVVSLISKILPKQK